MEGLGFDRDSMPTTDYSVGVDMDWESQKVIGYTATTAVELELEDLNALGSVIDKALEAGANDVSSIRFDVKDRRAARDQAIKTAFETAKRDAEVLAQASGSSLGRLVQLSIGGHPLGAVAEAITVSAGRRAENHHHGARGRGYSDAFRAGGAEKPRPIGGKLMSAPTPQEQILGIVNNYWQGCCVGAAAQLEFADQLANGPLHVDVLAERSKTHAPSLYRLLRALESTGIFTQTSPRVFANTPQSECLRRYAPGSQWAWIRISLCPDSFVVDGWRGLMLALKNGRTGFEQVRG